MVAKRKVKRREYNQWVKWLRKQGYSGPFAGLTTSHECVKLLARELKKEPPTILETRPRDPRTIVSNLTRYEREGKLGKQSETEVTEVTSLSEKYLIDHYERLHKMLERLYNQFHTPELSELCLFTLKSGTPISYSYVSEMHVPVITYEEEDIKLDVEASDPFLWECLKKHLIAEFPEFDTNLSHWKKSIATIVEKCHSITETIANKFTEMGTKMRWHAAEPYLSPDSKNYGPGVYYDMLDSLVYECVIANHVPQFRRGYDSRELVMEYPRGRKAIARGDDSLLDQVEQCCLGIVSDSTIKEKVKQVLDLVKQAEATLEPIKQNLRLVLERGTFKETCSICSDLIRQID